MTGNDRVILIKGDNSKWYEQAIFIIKKNAPAGKMPMDFVLEAENIINNYMMRTGKSKNQNLVSKYADNQLMGKPANRPERRAAKAKKSGADFIPYLVMLACCIILAYIVFMM